VSSRRAFLALGAVGLAYWGLRSYGPGLWARHGPLPELSFDRVPDGFRRLAGAAQVTGGLANPLVGLEPQAAAPPGLSDAELCAFLYDGTPSGKVSLNYFTDYNCPYCRVLGRDLMALAAARPADVHLAYHELPMLGPASVIGAKAALAAGRQGQYHRMHTLLNTGIVRINEGYVMKIATELGLDTGKLAADMEGPGVARQIARSMGAARRFAVIGTPFLLVGRTAVYGRIRPETLDRLVDAERPDGRALSCR
jgi:protein-disulfide isomerase